jgi:signal transduction histidine kinase
VVVRTLTVGPQVKVLVEDDGVGIHGPEGFGMRGIRERASLLGGTVQWDALETGGTRMTLTIPLPGEQP